MSKRVCSICGSENSDTWFYGAMHEICRRCYNVMMSRHKDVRRDANSITGTLEDLLYYVKYGYPPKEIKSVIEQIWQALDVIDEHLERDDTEGYTDFDKQFQESGVAAG